MTPLHLGDLHAVEQLLVGVLALGPFLVLAVVVHLARRRDLAEEARDRYAAEGSAAGEPGLPDLSLTHQRLDEDARDE